MSGVSGDSTQSAGCGTVVDELLGLAGLAATSMAPATTIRGAKFLISVYIRLEGVEKTYRSDGGLVQGTRPESKKVRQGGLVHNH